MIRLKTIDELEKGINKSLYAFVGFLTLGTAMVLINLNTLGFFVIMISLVFEIQRNAELTRLELRLMKKEYIDIDMVINTPGESKNGRKQ